MEAVRHAVAIGFFLVAASAPVLAQSGPGFDCAKASNATERAICGNAEIAASDRALSSFYVLRLTAVPPELRGQLEKDQARWIADRNQACGNVTDIVRCLKMRYEARRAFLRAATESPYPFVSERALIGSGKVGSVSYSIDASYPHFDGSGADFGPANRVFSDGAKIAAADATPDARSDLKREQTWTYLQGFTLHRPGARAMSVVLQSYAFTGGAHGTSNTSAWLVNLDSGRLLAPEEVFVAGDSWRRQLREWVTADLRKQFVERPGFEEALAPDKMDEMLRQSTRYVWRADGLAILFNQYDVAAGVMGPYIVRVPYDRLKPLLRPDAPVGQ